MFTAGDKFAGYEILERLKGGGMATLFLARRGGASGFRKHVAIKVVHQHLAEDETFVHMFVDEALLSSRIHHPNVVHIEELRQLDGQHFLVMEYVAGVSLAQLLRRLSKLGRGMNPELAAYVAIQIADGLHAAHELRDETGKLEGLVHRDISPQNVLIAWEGHVKLIDFGVAKARSRVQQTTGASLKGKIRYMAPEQAIGDDVDRRTDIYALGVVLWEMLTMRRRFHGKNDFALLEQVRNPEAIPPSRHRADVAPELDAVVLHTMERAPDDRFASAQAFRRALAKAAPSSLALDSSHLSDFVRAACEEELEKARARLPGSMSLPVSDAEREGMAEPLKTMSVTSDQIIDFTDSVSVSVSFTPTTPSSAMAVPPKVPAVIASGPSGRDDVPLLGDSSVGPTPEPGDAADMLAAGLNQRPRLAVIAVVLALAAVGGGIYAASGSSEDARATIQGDAAGAPPTPSHVPGQDTHALDNHALNNAAQPSPTLEDAGARVAANASDAAVAEPAPQPTEPSAATAEVPRNTMQPRHPRGPRHRGGMSSTKRPPRALPIAQDFGF